MTTPDYLVIRNGQFRPVIPPTQTPDISYWNLSGKERAGCESLKRSKKGKFSRVASTASRMSNHLFSSVTVFRSRENFANSRERAISVYKRCVRILIEWVFYYDKSVLNTQLCHFQAFYQSSPARGQNEKYRHYLVTYLACCCCCCCCCWWWESPWQGPPWAGPPRWGWCWSWWSLLLLVASAWTCLCYASIWSSLVRLSILSRLSILYHVLDLSSAPHPHRLFHQDLSVAFQVLGVRNSHCSLYWSRMFCLQKIWVILVGKNVIISREQQFEKIDDDGRRIIRQTLKLSSGEILDKIL